MMEEKEGKHALARYVYISHMCRAAPSRRISMKLGMSFEVADIINRPKFHIYG